MTYGNQFLKFTWLFTIVGTDEIANTSIDYTTAPGWTGAVTALGEIEVLDQAAIYGNMPTLLGNGAVLWANYSRCVGLKIAAVGTDGAYLADPVVFLPDTPDAGTDNATLPQSTIVVSLRSGFTLGKGNYGRMYLPHTRFSLNSGTPFGNPTFVASFAEAAKDFVNGVTDDVNSATTATLFPAIMSQATGSLTRGVTEVKVGNVVDTQRRRRNALIETYSTSELA